MYPIDRSGLIEIVESAAVSIAQNFGLPLVYESKRGRSFAGAAVTAIDRDIQAKLMELLPGNFMGEEDGGRDDGGEYVWLVDPLDGTGARIRGLPTSTCIVTLMRRHRSDSGYPVMTVIHNPVTRQTWSAELDHGAFYKFGDNEEVRCQLNKEGPAPEKILSTITLWPGEDFRFDEVKRAVETSGDFDNQDFGGLGAAHASVVTGTTHLSACRASAAFETAAATLLMKEAGGIAWNLEGGNLAHIGFPIEMVRGKKTFSLPKGAIIASNRSVALKFLKIILDMNQ